MKKFQLLGVALVAVFAVGVLTVASASAAPIFLLAEWLLNSVAVLGAVLVEAPGTLLLEDTLAIIGIAPASVLCTGILDGFVEENSLDLITDVLTELGGEVNLTVLVEPGLACTNVENCPEPLVWAHKLPWETEVELIEDPSIGFVVLILGSPGYEILCMGNNTTDLCEALEGVFELNLEGATLLALFSDAITELAGLKLGNCELGGAEMGVVEGEGTILDSEGGELSASSDSMEA